MDVWLIIHIILAVLLFVNSAWSYASPIFGTGTYFIATFFLLFEILIVAYPFVRQLEPYFGFLSNPVGPALSLIVISIFYFYSLDSFCKAGGAYCLGQVTGCIVFIVCCVELFMKKDALYQVGSGAFNSAKSLGNEGIQYAKNGNAQQQDTAPQAVEAPEVQEYQYQAADAV